jgi:hypothetical protein
MKQDKYLHDLKEHIKVLLSFFFFFFFFHLISPAFFTCFSGLFLDVISDELIFYSFLGDIYYPMESHRTRHKQS